MLHSRTMRCAALLAAGLTASTLASAYVEPEQLYKTGLTKAQTIDPVGSFGEQVSLRAGTLSFRNVDIELPGTGPTIRIVRSAQLEDGYGTRTSSGNAVSGWEFDIPRLKTITADPLPAIRVKPLSAGSPIGWQVPGTDKNARCTNFAPPPHVEYPGTTVQFLWYEWWFGYQLVDDNGNEQAVFPRTTGMPAQAQHKIGTAENWVIDCLPTTANGEPGEAFLAISPDGTKYWLNHLTYAGYEDLIQVFENQPPKGYDLNYSLPRRSASMLVTRIEDRFGNWVNYSYNGSKLAAITASDGRSVTFAWQGNSATVTVGTSPNTQVWTYGPSGSYSMQVTQPDGSYWGYSGDFWLPATSPYEFAGCSQGTVYPVSGSRDVSVRAPSGATAAFHLDRRFFGRSYTFKTCGKTPTIYDGDPGFSRIPKLWIGYALTTKTVSGPGLPTQTWNYAYSPHNASWQNDCPTPTSCASTVWTQVTEPGGERTVSVFSNRWDQTENKLVREETYATNNALLRAVDYTYATTPSNAANPYPWPLKIGTFSDPTGNDEVNLRWTPVKRKTITQQGVSFVWEANTYDNWAKPLSVSRSSSLGYSRTDTTSYLDDTTLWVLGQATSSTNSNTGLVESQTDYWPATALPQRTWAFGKAQQYLVYNADGTLASVTDGNNHTTTLSNWKRGIPQTITFADNSAKWAQVNDLGQIDWVQDESNAKTCYGYDAMGRVNRITYPSEVQAWECNQDNWLQTTISFAPSASPVYGLAANHWRRYESTGNARKVTFYDALWRPVVQETYDIGNTWNTITQTVTRYDSSGRVTYASYPQRNSDPAVYNTWANPSVAPNALGTWTTYDALGRPTQMQQNSEHGLLTTTQEYLSGFATRITDARGQPTTTYYMAYDQPSTDWPTGIALAEGALTHIYRDVFGKPEALVRHNLDNSQWSARYYAYDAHQRLCKQSEVETSTTAFGYDDAGNLTWSATALPWSPYSPCEYTPTHSEVATRRVDRLYDARNRLTDISFRDGNGNQHWTYTPDGLPDQVTTWNDGGVNTVTNSYQYNKRRLLVGEQTGQPGWYNWSLGYAYDIYGNLATQTYPTGLAVSYTLNALGQATQVSSGAQIYASGISYYPNGGIQQFTYGNGLTHTLTQNARQLPQVSTDTGGVLSHQYSYDYNGNVTQIEDLNRGSHYSRWMTYDGLNRLKSAGSCSFNTTTCWFYYDYDTLDNLTRVQGADGSDRYYCYDARQQLTNIKSGPCTSGASVVGLGYDDRGNLNNKNGQAYAFDFGNRLRQVVGKEDYRYDAQGRRVLAWHPTDSSVTLSQYSQAGQLFYDENTQSGLRNEYIYLAGSLLAKHEIVWATGVVAVKYQHTDALGTPVAETNAAGAVIQRSEYDPYGRLNNRPLTNGPGYTGHYQDAATGLTYMQQRYYDPTIGRFLSMDPVTADANTGGNFNRYWYANNNPYRFIDPDGRDPQAMAYWQAWDKIKAFFNSPAGTEMVYNAGILMNAYSVTRNPRTAAMEMEVAGVAMQNARQMQAARVQANGARGRASEARVLSEMGLTKNTTKVSTAEGNAIPDGLTSTLSVEVKDAAKVSLTRQARIETQAAKEAGQTSVLVTGAKTCVSGNCEKAYDQIIRRTDLGPQN
ncbi:RHS repeat-associated core domain-containing protein [Luteimonas gilva]|nr:RHS repeat-associated core domain-containing protein [Luteimonas gilva]